MSSLPDNGRHREAQALPLPRMARNQAGTSGCLQKVGAKGKNVGERVEVATAGKWRACGWAVAQLDHDEAMGPLHGMFCSVEAEFEVQRTIKRAELTAFLCLLRKVSGPIKVHVDNKGIIDGLRKGEKECSSQEQEMQTCG